MQQKISSVQFKTHLEDLKEGMVMIPSTYCFGDDTCLIDFIFSNERAHSTRSLTHY
jgi:hypothetical protein